MIIECTAKLSVGGASSKEATEAEEEAATTCTRVVRKIANQKRWMRTPITSSHLSGCPRHRLGLCSFTETYP